MRLVDELDQQLTDQNRLVEHLRLKVANARMALAGATKELQEALDEQQRIISEMSQARIQEIRRPVLCCIHGNNPCTCVFCNY